jgi:hypothetical protein
VAARKSHRESIRSLIAQVHGMQNIRQLTQAEPVVVSMPVSATSVSFRPPPEPMFNRVAEVTVNDFLARIGKRLEPRGSRRARAGYHWAP